ncbi:hypothetical protein [Bailinhaonella thermotolerans]|uniref:hypothetical protein n=1 Tax=Bailinhaonella thermotolerans TaxID=1070861 RepID=UPI00192A19F1|nr:hypothetical protein [Bailinhaonella thermotolerans]
MSELLTLEPRVAGAATLEPTIAFDNRYAGLHLRTGCVPTCTCSGGSSVCGRSTRV